MSVPITQHYLSYLLQECRLMNENVYQYVPQAWKKLNNITAASCI